MQNYTRGGVLLHKRSVLRPSCPSAPVHGRDAGAEYLRKVLAELPVRKLLAWSLVDWNPKTYFLRGGEASQSDFDWQWYSYPSFSCPVQLLSFRTSIINLQ